MRPRTELAIAAAAFTGLVVLALAVGRERSGSLTTDRRASSLVTGPAGTRALAEVWERAGGRVTRWRQRPRALPATLSAGATVALIQPSRRVDPGDVLALLELTERQSNLLVAGPGASAIHACLGYGFNFAILDSAQVLGPSGTPRGGVRSTFAPRRDTSRTLSSGLAAKVACPIVPVSRVDTLLRTVGGDAVALRLERGDSPRVILLVSDAMVLGTRGLRTAELPEVLVRELMGHGRHLLFDEYHHVGAGGSLARSALAWSGGSPWGWMVWQLALVGFLAFVAGAVRFGAVRRRLPRERRSPLEHVKALATALSSANGHDAAIAAIVAGLRRRLATASGERSRGARQFRQVDWGPWAGQLAARAPDPAARDAARRLAAFATPGQPDTAVRAAANAVEDVWEALRH